MEAIGGRGGGHGGLNTMQGASQELQRGADKEGRFEGDFQTGSCDTLYAYRQTNKMSARQRNFCYQGRRGGSFVKLGLASPVTY